jgi:hypothetical protein
MGKQLVSFNGVTATYMHEEQDGRVAFETVADVTPILERAKALHNEGFNRTGMGDRHVASLPIPVIDAWARARGKRFADVMQDDNLFTLFLQDPDNSGFIIDKASVK